MLKSQRLTGLTRLLLLGHIAAVLRTQMRSIVTDRVAWSVCRFVKHIVMTHL